MDTVVSFVTERFNTTVSKSTFINPGCFGDDLASWLAEELRAEGLYIVGAPIPEDYGWALQFKLNTRRYAAAIGYIPAFYWYIAVERSTRWAIFHPRFRSVSGSAVDAIKRVLWRAREIRDIQWHSPQEFFSGVPKSSRY